MWLKLTVCVAVWAREGPLFRNVPLTSASKRNFRGCRECLVCDCTLVCSYSHKVTRTGVHPALGCVYKAIGLLMYVVLIGRCIKRFCLVSQMHIVVPSAVVSLKVFPSGFVKANHRDTNQPNAQSRLHERLARVHDSVKRDHDVKWWLWSRRERERERFITSFPAISGLIRCVEDPF